MSAEIGQVDYYTREVSYDIELGSQTQGVSARVSKLDDLAPQMSVTLVQRSATRQ
jgi:hypothetical protein